MKTLNQVRSETEIQFWDKLSDQVFPHVWNEVHNKLWRQVWNRASRQVWGPTVGQVRSKIGEND